MDWHWSLVYVRKDYLSIYSGVSICQSVSQSAAGNVTLDLLLIRSLFVFVGLVLYNDISGRATRGRAEVIY